MFPLFSLSGRRANLLSPLPFVRSGEMFGAVFGGGGFASPSACMNSGRIFHIPPFFLIRAMDNPIYISPSVRRRGDVRRFVLPPLFGEGRSVFRRRRKGVGVFWRKKRTALIGNELEKSRRLPQSRCRLSAERRDSVSRGRDRARSGNGTLHVPFPSSQAAKSPPGSLQESACSPPRRRLQYGIVHSKKALSHPQEGAEKKHLSDTLGGE